jgi:hypothetical protein
MENSATGQHRSPGFFEVVETGEASRPYEEELPTSLAVGLGRSVRRAVPSKVKTSSSRIRRNDGPRGCTASRKVRASLVEGARSRTETLRPRRMRRGDLGHPASWGGLPPPGARDGDEGRQGQPERLRTTVRSHDPVSPPGGSSKDSSRSILRRDTGDGVTTGSGTGARNGALAAGAHLTCRRTGRSTDRHESRNCVPAGRGEGEARKGIVGTAGVGVLPKGGVPNPADGEQEGPRFSLLKACPPHSDRL